MATHAEIVDHVEREVHAPTTYGRVAAALGTSARAVGMAMASASEPFSKGHLVLRSDWTVSPAYRVGDLGPEEAAQRLRADGYTVERLPSGRLRLVDPPEA